MPAALGRDLRGNGSNFWIGTTERPGRTVSQSGVFDQFLCETHKRAIHDYEEYAIQFIRAFELSEAEVKVRTFRRDGTDNESLIRFVCSVLWRYHHSTREETEDVDLGEWEPNLRDVTFGGSIYQAPDVLMRAIHQTLLPKDAFMMTPAPVEQWGRRSLQFTVPGLIFNIKLDHEDWVPAAVQSFVLNQTPSWLIGAVVFWGENEWRTMKQAGARMQELTPRPRPR
jgi:hypothetical protein